MNIKIKNLNSCTHCGNNPTPHLTAWIDSTVCEFMNPLSQMFLETFFGKILFGITDFILKSFLWIFEKTHIIYFNADPSCIIAERGAVISEEAFRRGWRMETMCFLGKATDAYRIIFPNNKKLFFTGLPRVGNHTEVISGWIDDKAILKKRLSDEGVPVSRGASFHDFKKAESFFRTLQKPVITKPRLGSRGRHTTTHLYNETDFKRAFMIAKQLGRSVIVEEHLIGSVYRGTVIEGILIGVLAGDPPRITGDGVHTIYELVEIKNQTRDSRVGVVCITPELSTFLQRLKYSLDTILTEGIIIDLSEKIGISYGGNSREVTPLVHPKLRYMLEKAARVVNDPILGFDFITTDVSVDPETVRWGIIECNSVPFINLHHHPIEGVPINVAEKVLDYVERVFPAK